MTPQLDLTKLTGNADSELLQRVSHDLASYYMALPLAHEEGRVTVVTAHPDNHAAFQVLARLLGGEIVPITGSETAVGSAIDQVYATHAPQSQILSWTDDPAWRECVQATATLYGEVLGRPVIHLPYAGLPADGLTPGLPPMAGQSPASLLVCHLDDHAKVAHVMRHSPVSLLLAGGAPVPTEGDCQLPQRVLLALRGYGSDWAAVKQVHQLSARTPLDITVLPLAEAFGRPPTRPRSMPTSMMPHLNQCLKILGAESTRLRLRAGNPAEQLIAELSQNAYDLVVIAAEAWGEFVLETLDKAVAAGVMVDQPILIIRPPVDWDQPLPVSNETTLLSED